MAVIGAGVMGIGIVQVALLAGHPVLLFDTRAGAAAAGAGAQLGAGRWLRRWREKGRLGTPPRPIDDPRFRARLRIAGTRSASSPTPPSWSRPSSRNLAVKPRRCSPTLEGIVGDGCVLASNTSSLSITALARGLRLPGRVVGMHFFNPVPLMARLVEVVLGSRDRARRRRRRACARRATGARRAVHAKSTPGFIVNRVARPFYAETLALLQEQAATPAVLDACVRGAGFRMGPCELMEDLIGHDTNFAVTQAVYEANFFDKRFQPSLVQREMVDGGLLGRKSGRGFYRYPEDPAGASTDAGPAFDPSALAGQRLVLHGSGAIAELLAARLEAGGLSFSRAAATEQTLAGIAESGRHRRLHRLARRPWPGRPARGRRPADRPARGRAGLLMLTAATEMRGHAGQPPISRCSTGRSAPRRPRRGRRLRRARSPTRSPSRRRRPSRRAWPPCLHALGWQPLRLAPTCRASWWRAPSRCLSTRRAMRSNKACATRPARTRR